MDKSIRVDEPLNSSNIPVANGETGKLAINSSEELEEGFKFKVLTAFSFDNDCYIEDYFYSQEDLQSNPEDPWTHMKK